MTSISHKTLQFVTRQLALTLALLCAMAFLGSAPGRADEVDIAVEAFAVGGQAVGVSIGEAEKQLVKGLVRCAVGGKSVVDCARDELINRLPEQAQPFARCMAFQGKTVQQCVVDGAIQQLPPQARDLAECIATSGDLGQCGKDLAMDQLDQAKRAALKEALATIDKVKADARSQLGDGAGTIMNIIRVVQAIRDEDWPKVALYGGAEVYKIVLKAALRTVLPAPAAPLVDKAVDALVDQRADLYAGLYDAAKRGDEGKLAELGAQIYIYSGVPAITATCALMPDGAVKDATCGNIQKAIEAVGGVVGDAAEGVNDGINDLITGRRDDCGTRWQYYDRRFAACLHHAVLAKQLDPARFKQIEGTLNHQCRTHFHPCAKKAIGSTSDRISEICNPVRDRFWREADELHRRLREAAATYAQAYPPLTLKIRDGEDCEARASQKFFVDCTNALQGQFPERSLAANCTLDGKQSLGHAFTISTACANAAFSVTEERPSTPDEALKAFRDKQDPFDLRTQIKKQRLSFQAWCELPKAVQQFPIPADLAPKLTKEPPPAVQKFPIPGDLAPKLIKEPPAHKGAGAPVPLPRPPAQCPSGWSGVYPTCCHPGTVYRNGTCVQPTAGRPCPAGQMRMDGGRCATPGPDARPCPPPATGTWPRCQCPHDQQWTGARCIASKASAGVRCPDGSHRPSYAFCRKRCPDGSLVPTIASCPTAKPPPPKMERRCPPGMVGRWPRCYRPGRPPQQGKCPPGSIGRWPNCGSVVK